MTTPPDDIARVVAGRLAPLHRWLNRRRDQQLLHRWGGIQTCPWCRQRAQHGLGWSFQEWDRDPFLDVLTCGVCGGTSLWRFEMGMMFIGSLTPPTPAFPDVDYYDVRAAHLKGTQDDQQ
jgi:hypothetical protein